MKKQPSQKFYYAREFSKQFFICQNTRSSNEFFKGNIQGQEPGMFAFNVAFV